MESLKKEIAIMTQCNCGSVDMIEQAERVASLIESKFQELQNRIEVMEKSHSLPHEHVHKLLPCDKDGEPEGGLKKFDLIWHKTWKTSGIFDCGKDGKIGAWWAKCHHPDEPSPYEYESSHCSQIKFILRPEKQDC